MTTQQISSAPFEYPEHGHVGESYALIGFGDLFLSSSYQGRTWTFFRETPHPDPGLVTWHSSLRGAQVWQMLPVLALE